MSGIQQQTYTGQLSVAFRICMSCSFLYQHGSGIYFALHSSLFACVQTIVIKGPHERLALRSQETHWG